MVDDIRVSAFTVHEIGGYGKFWSQTRAEVNGFGRSEVFN